MSTIRSSNRPGRRFATAPFSRKSPWSTDVPCAPVRLVKGETAKNLDALGVPVGCSRARQRGGADWRPTRGGQLDSRGRPSTPGCGYPAWPAAAADGRASTTSEYPAVGTRRARSSGRMRAGDAGDHRVPGIPAVAGRSVAPSAPGHAFGRVGRITTSKSPTLSGVAAREDPGSRRQVAPAGARFARPALGGRPHPGPGARRSGGHPRRPAGAGRDQGPGPRRRPGQGGRRQAGGHRPTRPRRSRARSSAWTSRESRCARCSWRRPPTSSASSTCPRCWTGERAGSS